MSTKRNLQDQVNRIEQMLTLQRLESTVAKQKAEQQPPKVGLWDRIKQHWLKIATIIILLEIAFWAMGFSIVTTQIVTPTETVTHVENCITVTGTEGTEIICKEV